MDGLDLYSLIRRRILEASQRLAQERCLIDGVFTLRLTCQPRVGERVFDYDVIFVQTEFIGAAYSFPDTVRHAEGSSLVGQDARNLVPESSSPLGVAILDALAGSLSTTPSETFKLEGLAYEKARLRAQIVAQEVARLAEGVSKPKATVAVVGVVGNVIELLSLGPYDIIATDLDPNIIGKELHGVTILDGTLETDLAIKHADIAVVTGMTFSTGSLSGLLNFASNCRVLLVAETGARLGEFFLEERSIHTVVSEPFPFYVFAGPSVVNVFRKLDFHA